MGSPLFPHQPGSISTGPGSTGPGSTGPGSAGPGSTGSPGAGGSPGSPGRPEPSATSPLSKSSSSGRPLLKLPLHLRALAVLSICVGLWGAMTALAEVNGALLLDRQSFVLRVRDRQVMLFDQLQQQMSTAEKGGRGDFFRPLVAPFMKLPRADAERLALLLGDALYDRRGVAVPLGVLQLILSWLLISGSLATLRRQSFGIATWSFACWVNIFFALLNMLVTFVHSRTLMDRLGKPVADALALANGHGADFELHGLWQLTRLYVLMRAAVDGVWVLILGVAALCLQRLVQQTERSGERAAPLSQERDRSSRSR